MLTTDYTFLHFTVYSALWGKIKYRLPLSPCVLFWMGSKLVILGGGECSVFVNRALRRTFAPEREGVTGEYYIIRNFIICTFHQIFLNDRTKADGRDLENSLKTWLICKYVNSFCRKAWRRERALLGTCHRYRGSDKPLARPGRKQATATKDSEFHISYL
jgi:hypothetical protein